MTFEGVTRLDTDTCLIPFADVTPWRVTGSDHRETMQRLVTQDVRHLAPGDGRLALLLAPRGQFRALFAVFAGADEFILIAPPGRSEALRAALAPYLALSKTRLEPWAGLTVFGIFGPMWRGVVEEFGAAVDGLDGGGWSLSSSGNVTFFAAGLFGVAGALAMTTDPNDTLATLAAAGIAEADRGALEVARITVAFPAWGAELDAQTLPPETGIEDLAISATKGCYIGQETMARLRTRGHANRRMVRVHQIAGPVGGPVLPLALTAAGDEKPRATLTSYAVDPDGRGIGLAMVRREIAEPGTALLAGPLAFAIVT